MHGLCQPNQPEIDQQTEQLSKSVVERMFSHLPSAAQKSSAMTELWAVRITIKRRFAAIACTVRR
jgi:hypothetical protein